MRKTVVQVILVAAIVSLCASFALADNFIHGNYTKSTNACANCHIFHAAPAVSLLKIGPTQTQLCFLCHGNGATASPYDAQGGLIAGSVESSAGGFDSIGGIPVTSRHIVGGYEDNDSPFVEDIQPSGYKEWIPGGNNTLVGSGLVCSSCHNIHAGGTGFNPRLLRTEILDVPELIVTVTEEPVGEPHGVTGYQPTRITGYESGFTAWCASCHDLLARETGAGHSADEAGLFRHATNVDATIEDTLNSTTGSGIPLEGSESADGLSSGTVTCLTCHRSHGTTAEMSEYAAGFLRRSSAAGEAETVYSSALLRLGNRDVCYACHGAATRNKPGGDGQLPD